MVKAWDFDSHMRAFEPHHPCHTKIYERVIHIGTETQLGTAERVCVYFHNGSRLEVLGTAIDMEISDGFSKNVASPPGKVLMRRPAPSLSVTVSGDINLMLFGVEEQPVNISTLDGLI